MLIFHESSLIIYKPSFLCVHCRVCGFKIECPSHPVAGQPELLALPVRPALSWRWVLNVNCWAFSVYSLVLIICNLSLIICWLMIVAESLGLGVSREVSNIERQVFRGDLPVRGSGGFFRFRCWGLAATFRPSALVKVSEGGFSAQYLEVGVWGRAVQFSI